MLKKRLTTTLSILALTLLCSGNAFAATNQEKAAAPAKATVSTESKPARDPVAQLRGKLLYRRGRMRKLEREVLRKDPALSEKIKQLQAEIESLYCSAEPRLATLYAEEKELNGQIESLSKKD